jgi:hypothetical protein
MANPETGTETMKKKKAAGLTAASNNERNKAYLSTKSLSTLKIIVGGLLLFGNAERRAFWPLFDVLLRQLEDLKLASQSRSNKTGQTKSGNGGVG